MSDSRATIKCAANKLKYSSGSTGAVNATSHIVPADSYKHGGSSNTRAGTKTVNNHISAATFNEKNAVIFIAAAFLEF